MKSQKAVSLSIFFLVVALTGKPLMAEKPGPAPDVLLTTMEKELHRGQTELAKQDPAPYYTSYNVTDGESLVIYSAQGAVLNSTYSRNRAADVSMRIGSPALDNTHDHERDSGITSAICRCAMTPTRSRACCGS